MKRRKFIGLSIVAVGAAIPVAVVAKSDNSYLTVVDDKSNVVYKQQLDQKFEPLKRQSLVRSDSGKYSLDAAEPSYLTPEERLTIQDEINRRRSVLISGDYDMQWSKGEIKILKSRNAPPLVINRIK